MPKQAIRLNPEKVALKIASARKRHKQLLNGMHTKTVQRIKAGGNTTRATAELLAKELGTTVEDLMAPATPAELSGLLPDQWLYDTAPPSDSSLSDLPFHLGVGNGLTTFLVSTSPDNFGNPLTELLKWHDINGKHILLRQENQAFVFEIQHFNYFPDREQHVRYYASTACRFFPLSRNGDAFTKTALAPLLQQYVWNHLQQQALTNADLVSIEGHDYPTDPHAYFPIVSFARGIATQRRLLGIRVFEQLHGDLRWSLIAYLRGLGERRYQARASTYGIGLTVDAVRPAVYTPDWYDAVLEMEILLAWRRPDGTLALAPWRAAHRELFAAAMNQREWQNIYSPGMPIAVPRDEDDANADQGPPPFTADPDLAPATIQAIRGITYPDPLPLLWESQFAALTTAIGQPQT